MGDERRRLERQMIFYARLLLLVLGLSPWLVPLARAHLSLGAVGEVLDGVFIIVCHRRPERTLELAGVAMPLCSRCAGIFLGFATAGALAWPRWPLRSVRNAVLLAGLLMLAAVIIQDMGVHPIWHSTRILTGTLLGHFMGLAIVSALRR